MKKLLILLGSVTLSLSPVLTIVSCGAVPVVVPVVSPAAGIAAASLKTEIYGEILENYNKRIEDMSKTIEEVNKDGHAYSYLSLDNMKSKFSGDNTTIDLNSAKLSNDDLLKLSKDLNFLLGLEDEAKNITEIASNQNYDIITSQVGKKVFKGWVIIPHSLSRVITNGTGLNEDPKMVQFSFSMAVSYQIYLDGSVQTITSDKINCSFTLTTEQVLKDFIVWANNTIPSYLYSPLDSPLRFNSSDETFKLHSPDQWKNDLNDFKKNFNSNVNNYFQSDSFNKDSLGEQLNNVLKDPKEHGFKPDKDFNYTMEKIKSDDIIVDNKEIITPQATYGLNVDYTSNIKRLDVSKFGPDGNSNHDQDIINLVFDKPSSSEDDNEDIVKFNNASKEFADFNSEVPSALAGIDPPLDNEAFKQNYNDFMKKYNSSNDMEITPDDNNNIYSYGNINLEPIAIKFDAFSSSFNLNLNVPWSFSLYQDGRNLVDRRFSTMSYFDALIKWKTALKVSFFNKHKTTSKKDATSFMTLDTYDKGGASGNYVDVDPNFYNNDISNDTNVYNMIGDMNNTDEGSFGFNLDDNSIAKSSVWDNAIGKYSRNGLGLTQYYFEKYAGLLPDENSPLGEESPWQWKDQSRIAEENGLVYFGFHYDTDENETPTADVSMPFTNLESIRRDKDFQIDADGYRNLVPKMWHSKIRHEQDDKYNGNNLVYTLSMGNFGLLNLSFPSFKASGSESNPEILVGNKVFSIWEYLWNPGHDSRLEAMRIIADNSVEY